MSSPALSPAGPPAATPRPWRDPRALPTSHVSTGPHRLLRRLHLSQGEGLLAEAHPHRPRRPLRPSPRPAASTFLTWLGYVLVGPPLTAKARDSHVVWFCFGCFFFGFGLFLVVSFFGFAYKPNCNFPVPKSLSSWPVASERCPNS